MNSKKLKILHITPRFYPDLGGVENVVMNLTSGLIEIGHEIYVLTTTKKKYLNGHIENINGIKVERMFAYSPNNAYFYSPDLGKRIEEISKEFDIIHAHGYHAFPSFHAYRNRNNKKFILSTYYHGKSHKFLRNILLKFYKKITKKMVLNSNRIICISKAEEELLQANFPTKNTCVIHVGTEICNTKIRDDLSGKNRVIFMGRLEKYKNCDRVLEIIKEIPEVELDIIGSGPEIENLQKITKDMGIENRVFFHGYVEEKKKKEILKDGLCLITLSDYESFGIVIIEAISNGLPVIASNIGSHKEIADTLENGVKILNKDDKNNIIRTIKELLNHGYKGKNPHINKFDWNEIIKQYDILYQEIENN